MAYSFEQFPCDGATNQFTVNFPYLAQSHISVKVDDVDDPTFSWINSTLVQTTSMPADGATVEVRRRTPGDPLTDFEDGSTLGEGDLDRTLLQALYIAQEAIDDVTGKLSLNSEGRWDAETKRISNVVDPVDAQDAATKQYVADSIVSAGNVPTPANPGDDNKVLKASSGSWSWASIVVSMISDVAAFMKTFLGSADVAAARSNLGLGSVALENVGTSGDAVGKLDTENTWNTTQSFQGPVYLDTGGYINGADKQAKRLIVRDTSDYSGGGVSSVGGVLTLDHENGPDFTTTLTEAIDTLTINHWPPSGVGHIVLEVTADAVTEYPIAFGTIDFGNAGVPSVAPGSKTELLFRKRGANLLGNVTWQGTA